MVNGVQHDNFGFALDTYHMYKGGDKLNDYQEIPVERIFSVHVQNVLDIPRNRITDFDREYPLDGKLNLLPFVRLLANKGYQGYLTVELFNEEYWQEDPSKIAKLAHESLVKLVELV